MKVDTSKFNDSLSVHPVAYRVLKGLKQSARLKTAITRTNKRDQLADLKTAAWYNGRERGIVAWLERVSAQDRRMCVVFGECRSSDSIFVDVGEAPPDLNPPCCSGGKDDWYEAAWAARRTFDLLAGTEAAEAKAVAYAAEYLGRALEG